jgi:hypothetical protein
MSRNLNPLLMYHRHKLSDLLYSHVAKTSPEQTLVNTLGNLQMLKAFSLAWKESPYQNGHSPVEYL